MNILLVLVPISLLLLGAAVWAFVWAARRGQFDDLETPAIEILAEEDAPLENPSPARSGHAAKARRNGERANAPCDDPDGSGTT